MNPLVAKYAKSFAALAGLLASGAVLYLVGQHEAGAALIVAAPTTAGLVRQVPNRRKR